MSLGSLDVDIPARIGSEYATAPSKEQVRTDGLNLLHGNRVG